MKMKFITLTVLIMISLSLTASANEDLMFAVGLYEDGNYTLAQQELVKYLAEYPQSDYRLEASYLLADIYLEQKNYQQANEIFGKLSKTPPATMPYSDILSGLGQSYYYLQNYNEAIKVFTQLISKYPQDEQISRFYYFLGVSMIETGEFELAEENLLMAMNIDDRVSVRL
ncbi:MAG: tetratricopeptide repeat protein, partial [Candidatus Stygibacter australis]|nr:tetratricopeptide repeat protein [Candidatus Stygibacter australis]